MDIPRGKEVGRKKLVRRIVYIIVAVIALGGVTFALARLKPAAPSVERATVWIDSVKRGPMVVNVRGIGTLVPEDVTWLSAAFDGRVESIPHLPGTPVKNGEVIVALSNPDMVLAAQGLEWQVKAAQATYTDLKVRLETDQLKQKSLTEQAHSDYQQAELTAERDVQLTKLGLQSELVTKLSTAKAEELKSSWELAKDQLDISNQSIEAQLAAQKVNIENLQAQYALKQKQVDQLTVQAPVDGVLTALGAGTSQAAATSGSTTQLEVGQRVTPGTILAKISQPSHLKATLKIPETQAKDVAIGQEASIDTRNGIIPGRVERIDPAVTNGTVDVDVKLLGALPDYVRPDLSVDGTITIRNLANVLYVGRPVIGQQDQKVGLFKLDQDGKGASRVTVSLGTASVNTIEILGGLNEGDQVILSDMSTWDAHNRIRLD
jgi:HlyD family secretion protein